MGRASYLARTEETTMTRWTRVAAALLFVAVAASGTEKYLFIWAGDQSRGNPDFLAVVEFDAARRVVAEHPATPPADGFNPHGISVRAAMNLMVTSDFICPTSTLHAVPGGLDLRGSVRVWDLKRREIVRTVPIPGAGGTIDVKLIPNDPHVRAYTAGMLDDKLYLVDTAAGTATPVFDFKSI